MKTIFAILTAALLALPLHAQQSYAGCQLYPADSVFHMRVDSLPVSTNPAAQIPSADLTYHQQPIFGDLNGGFEINVVPATQPMVTVTGDTLYWTSAPVPPNAVFEGGAPNCTGLTPAGDSHLIVLQQAAASGGACTLYEAYGACPGTTSGTYNVNGEWGPVTTGDLGGYAMTPQDNTSDNASGIPLLPTLVTSADLAAGVIQHMIAISVPNPPRMYFDYLWPAADSSGAVSCTGGYEDGNHMLLDPPYAPTSCPTTAGPAAGTVFRRKASAAPLACVTAGTCPQTAMIELGAEQYGEIVVDNGGDFFGILGEQSAKWSDTDLANLKQDMVTNYEPVDVSGQAADLTAPIGNSSILAPVTTYRVNAPSTTGTPVAITATYNGVSLTATAVVNPAPATAGLLSLSISPATVTAGQTSTVTITLTAAAPSGGAVVTLSSNSTHFPVPASYTVPAGQTTASFTVTAQ